MYYEQIIPVLVGLSIVLIGGAGLLLRSARRAPLQARLQDITNTNGRKSSSGTTVEGGPGFTGVLGNIGVAVSKESSTNLREQLTQAGYHNSNAAAVYIGVKVILLVIGLVAALVLVIPSNMGLNTKIVLTGIGSLGLFLVPNMVVSSRRSKRRNEIRKHLPDAIDLLEICCSAGMGLDMSWNSVTDEIRDVSSTLADEMALANLEIHLGASRTDAMRHMANRTGADELSSLVAVLVQSERFGTSISDALQAFATFMRETRSQRAQETAEKMAVKLVFPMVTFIFPAVVMVMAGPAFISLYHALKPK